MFLIDAVLLFNLLCYLVPCDMNHKPPEILEQPVDPLDNLRNGVIRQTQPIVQTRNGLLEGYFMKAMNGRLFMAFEGIPYGEAERWKTATPAKPWQGIRQAKKPGPPCLQMNPVRLFRVWGSERCLYANIYTPNLPNNASLNSKYPVVVFIHGGSFEFSSGDDFGPTYLMSEDVVVVTFNYRLGVLGFLSTGDEVVPGNLGLKDQRLLLQYVHENIEYFNGNPANVSIWGQSAGSVSVHLHLLSPKSHPYFSTAFCSSGTAFQNWGVQSKEKLRQLTNRLAKEFRCPRNDSRKLMSCLRQVDVNLLVARQLSLHDWFPFPPVLYSPTVEPMHPDAFLTVSPTQAYQDGIVAKKPAIFSALRDEGQGTMLILIPLLRMIPLRRFWNQIAPIYLGLQGVVPNPDEMVRKIEQLYFKKGQNARNVDFHEFGKMVTDRYFHSGIVQGIQAHVSSGSPTYSYLFSFSEGNNNLARFIGYNGKSWGVGHVEDIMYLFNCSALVDGHKQNDVEDQLSKIMINLLVNFARTGKPLLRTPEGDYVSVWNPITNPSQIKMLQLDRDIKMIPLPEYMVERLSFWDRLNVPNMTLRSPLYK